MLSNLIKKFLGKNAPPVAPSPSQPSETGSTAAAATIPADNADLDLRQRGNALMQDGKLDEAIVLYRQAIAAAPHQASGYICLGYALLEMRSLDESEEALRQAAALQPRNADARFMMGNIAQQRGDDAGVVRELGAVLDIDPAFEYAYADLCLALFRLGQIDRAHEVVATGIEHFPENPQLHFYQGNLFAVTGAYQEGVNRFLRVLALQPDHAEALANLANCQKHLGAVDDAIASLRHAISLQPDRAAWHSNLLLTLQYHGSLDRQALFQEHLRFAEQFEAPLRAEWKPHPVRAPKSRLRVGYVSGDFRRHSLAYFIEPTLRHHDRLEVEVFCYYTFSIHDEVTARLQSLSDHWRSCADLTDEALAQQIRDDRIDVLVDLSGHTGHNRLLAFARKPAPVQMTWLGYQATTGLSAMDYRITDVGMDPPGMSEAFHSEKLLRVASAACFQPAPDSPPVNTLPALSGAPFTFGCLNNPAKTTSSVLDAWAEILRRVPNARLLMGGIPQHAHSRTQQEFEQRGISPSRLMLREPLPFADFMELHHSIDLCLDTFPYNGGTTSLHALWMGVPMVTLGGTLPVERAGTSMLGGFGLSEFATDNWQAYVDTAVQATARCNELNAIRQALRQNMHSALVAQASTLTRSMEQAMKLAFQEKRNLR